MTMAPLHAVGSGHLVPLPAGSGTAASIVRKTTAPSAKVGCVPRGTAYKAIAMAAVQPAAAPPRPRRE
jgi:hypothetical protein